MCWPRWVSARIGAITPIALRKDAQAPTKAAAYATIGERLLLGYSNLSISDWFFYRLAMQAKSKHRMPSIQEPSVSANMA